MHSLTAVTYTQALQELAERDPDLAQIYWTLGAPPMWEREPGFPTLIHIILEQQVSLASAKAAFDKLLAIATPLTPDTFLALDDLALREAGFSRQKTKYGRFLAEAIIKGQLDLSSFPQLSDDVGSLRGQADP